MLESFLVTSDSGFFDWVACLVSDEVDVLCARLKEVVASASHSLELHSQSIGSLYVRLSKEVQCPQFTQGRH